MARKRAPMADQQPPARHPGAQSGTRRPWRIVGVGASAGGLEAFSELLSHLPAKTGLAIVMIQHLPPSSASILPELLAGRPRLPVAR